jgi:tetratricopeptide (TPR) repeat protein
MGTVSVFWRSGRLGALVGVGKRLRQLRTARGMSQRELASPLYTAAYVSTIESGKRHPSTTALNHFAQRLDVEVDELLWGRSAELVARLEMALQEARIAISAGKFDEVSSKLDDIAEESSRFGLYELRAKTEEMRGLWEERQGRAEPGLEHYHRAEEVLENAPLPARADAVAGQARCLSMMGEASYAVHLLESLLSALRRLGLEDPNALVRIHSALVMQYLDLGLFTQAYESGSRALELAPNVSDPARIAQMHMNVARMFLQRSQSKEALKSLEQAQLMYRQLELRTETGGAYLARGYVLSRQGRLQEARSLLTIAITLFEESSNPKDQIRALNEMARIERLEGNLHAAEGLLQQSLALLDANDEPIAAWTHREMGRVIALRDPTRAEKHLRAAIELYERGANRVELALTYGVLGDLFDDQGDADLSRGAYRDGIAALESLV